MMAALEWLMNFKLCKYIIRLHQMYEMQTIVIDDRGVCLSRGRTRLHYAKMAKQMKILFGVNTLGGGRARLTLC